MSYLILPSFGVSIFRDSLETKDCTETLVVVVFGVELIFIDVEVEVLVWASESCVEFGVNLFVVMGSVLPLGY